MKQEIIKSELEVNDNKIKVITIDNKEFISLTELSQILGISINELLSGEKIDNNETRSEKIILDSLVENEKQRKRISQGSMLLGVAIAFNISTIIFGMHNQMVITFGGITFGFISAGMITLLTKNNKN